MDQNMKEMKKIYEWACENASPEFTSSVFTPFDTVTDSYFTMRDESVKYVYEYKFQDLPELKEKLEQMWKKEKYMSQIMTIVLAGAFKNRIDFCGQNTEQNVENNTEGNEISPYIYNF